MSDGKIVIVFLTVLILATGLFAIVPQTHDPVRLSLVQSEDGIHRLEYPGGKIAYKTLNDYVAQHDRLAANLLIDSSVFDLRSMSDSTFGSMYTFSHEAPISSGQVRPPVIGDANGNGKAEFYGYQKFYSTPGFSAHGAILEAQNYDSCRLVYSYPDSVVNPLGVYDINGDGMLEVVQRTWQGESVVFGSLGAGALPTDPLFGFNPFVGTEQMDRPTFGDFDGNGRTDVIYYLSSHQLSMFISEYDPVAQTMDTVYRFRPPDAYAEGFSVGDFDQNGKTDIILGSVHGYVYVLEAQGTHDYTHVWTGSVETYNAYLHMQTHDIDGNGQPEFWVGGDAYYSGLGITRFTCFESTGLHNYVPVHRIDLVGIFSFYAGNCFARDVDSDGREELFICIDQHVVILKFVGSPGSHQYKMYYLKTNEMADQNSVYYGATLFDLEGDDRAELVVTMDQVRADSGRRDFTRVYRPTGTAESPTSGPNPPNQYRLRQNYPNPFNSLTTIRVDVTSAGIGHQIRIAIYDILGREVKEYLVYPVQAGNFELRWNGDDGQGRPIGSGIYIIVMQAEGLLMAQKAILVK